MQKRIIIILSIIVGIGTIIGGIFLFRKKKLENPLPGTSGTVNDYRNFLMSQYVEHVRGKNKKDLEEWTARVMTLTDNGEKLTPENIIEKYDQAGAPRWASDWIKLKAGEPNEGIFNWKGLTYKQKVEQAVEGIVEWQATQTNWDKLVNQSKQYGYWFREMSENYPRITDRLEFLENVHITGINVN